MNLFELSSNKKKFLALFAGQWSSGMTLAFVVRSPGFNSRLLPFLFILTLFSRDVMNLFELSSNKKKLSEMFAGQWSSGMILA